MVTGPDLAVQLNAVPDPTFHFNADPDPDSDPASHQSYANLRPLVSRPSKAPF
jgi:hypothetical protein